MRPILIGAAKRIADEFGYDQVVVMARKIGEGGGEHVTTYGVDKEHCDMAARMGNFLKHRIMGWPLDEPCACAAGQWNYDMEEAPKGKAILLKRRSASVKRKFDILVWYVSYIHPNMVAWAKLRP